MAFYFVTGKLGSGKTLLTVGKIRDRLLSGCRVATNLNLNLENMLPLSLNNVDCLRLPDYPSIEDFEALGLGSTVPSDESKFGLIVLDETSGLFNARSWSDKSRAAIIEWIKHTRKLRWDVMFIAQSETMLDKQIRDSFGEHLVICKRLDRMSVPFVGWLFRLLGFNITMPKIHVGIVRYGLAKSDLVVARWMYRARDLYSAYDTEQVFSSDTSPALYSYLSPYSLKGHSMDKFQLAKLMSSGITSLAFAAGCIVTFYVNHYVPMLFKTVDKSNAQVVKDVFVTSYVINDGRVSAFLSDGRRVNSDSYAINSTGFSLKADDKIYSTKD